VWEDEIKLLDRTSIVPIQRSRQRTLGEFWNGCQTDDELGDELNKRMRVTDYSEDPSAVPYIPDKEDAGVALTVANLNRNGFPDLVVDDDDDFDFTNPVSWETIEEEAFLLLSRVSTPSRIRWRQIMFERHISSDVSFGNIFFVLEYLFISFMFPLFFCCHFWSKVTLLRFFYLILCKCNHRSLLIQSI